MAKEEREQGKQSKERRKTVRSRPVGKDQINKGNRESRDPNV